MNKLSLHLKSLLGLLICLTLSSCSWFKDQICDPKEDIPTVTVTKTVYVTVPDGYFVNCNVMEILSQGDSYEDLYMKFNFNKTVIKNCQKRLDAIQRYNEEAKKKNEATK